MNREGKKQEEHRNQREAYLPSQEEVGIDFDKTPIAFKTTPCQNGGKIDQFHTESKLVARKEPRENKSADMPRRPLNAYNLFFQLERKSIIHGEVERNYNYQNVERIAVIHYQQSKLERPKRKHRWSHGKISFAALARTVATKWKSLDESIKDLFKERAAIEKARYEAEIEEWTSRRLQPKTLGSEPSAESPKDYFSNEKNSPDGGNTFSIFTQADDSNQATMPLRIFRPFCSDCLERINANLRSPHPFFHNRPESTFLMERMTSSEVFFSGDARTRPQIDNSSAKKIVMFTLPEDAPAMTSLCHRQYHHSDQPPMYQLMERPMSMRLTESRFSQISDALEPDGFESCPVIRSSDALEPDGFEPCPVIGSSQHAVVHNGNDVAGQDQSFWPTDDASTISTCLVRAKDQAQRNLTKYEMNALLDSVSGH